MHKEFLMGNEAIAMGAIAAGLTLVSGYPGTPSTEVLETVAKKRNKDIYVEWSVNEKAGLEVAAGAAYCGGYSMVTMKQVGLNVASDPLMSLAYIGVKGAMVIMVADDPGPISSQTEQDTRTFGMYSKLPVFDPSSVQEAYEMIQEAFAYSKQYETPVIFRPTTRICHGYASIMVKDENEYISVTPEGFVKDASKWVIFPKLSNRRHAEIEERNASLKDVFSNYKRNEIIMANGSFSDSRKAIATHGISFDYVLERMDEENHPAVLKVATPFPFPESLAVEFLKNVDEVLCVEELDPVIERALTFVCGKYHLDVKIKGKLTNHIKASGENTVDEVDEAVRTFLGLPVEKEAKDSMEVPELPVRPPVLCAGCPHRGAFYAVKKAMQGQKAVFCGDIGCYTLGNAKPLDMTDTCLCMGAAYTIAQGIQRTDPDTTCFGFVGDSTFFASGITGVVNAFYNQANMVVVILDNSTTAMTGHQPHPGTGKTMMGEIVQKISIEKVLRAIGLTTVETVDPLDFEASVECVKRVVKEKGVKAIIFKSPCVALFKPETQMLVSDACIQCKKCINELGCPGIIIKDGKVAIDESLCNGCELCSKICPVGAIQKLGGKEHE